MFTPSQNESRTHPEPMMMTKLFRKIFERTIKSILSAVFKREVLRETAKLRNEIIMNYLRMENSGKFDPKEKTRIIQHLEKHPLAVFPYDFPKKYDAKDISVYRDRKMFFVLHENKRLYFPEKWRKGSVQNYYNQLLIEQDADSPHCYNVPGFDVRKGEIIVDIGAAEGIWALSHADLAGKIHLFECDEKWRAPLEMTFAPYQDKTRLTHKYIRNKTDSESTTLDDYLNGGGGVNFIKADIEGMEAELLDGAMKTLQAQSELRLLLCAYHRQGDEEILRNILRENGFDTEFSKGYMLFIYDENLHAPYLRRGLVRARKSLGNPLAGNV
jgi:hypothetical protein